MRARQENLVVVLLFAAAFVVLLPPAAAQPKSPDSFLEIVQTKTANRGSCKGSAACICSIADESIARRLLVEYGAIFAAGESVKLPSRCIFENESQVSAFQVGSKSRSEIMSGTTIELQDAAMTGYASGY